MTFCGAKTRGNPKKDQVEETRRVLREMWDKADRAIDDQTAVKITALCPLLATSRPISSYLGAEGRLSCR
jgi:hypothetical protein